VSQDGIKTKEYGIKKDSAKRWAGKREKVFRQKLRLYLYGNRQESDRAAFWKEKENGGHGAILKGTEREKGGLGCNSKDRISGSYFSTKLRSNEGAESVLEYRKKVSILSHRIKEGLRGGVGLFGIVWRESRSLGLLRSESKEKGRDLSDKEMEVELQQ